MLVELTTTNIITIIALFIAASWALVKVIGHQQEKLMKAQFDALAKAMKEVGDTQKKNAESTLQLDREFRDFQNQALRDFVRRDDFVRHVGTIETRIDNFALRMERALEHLGGKSK